MKNKELYTGIIPPLVTPLTKDEALDSPALVKLVEGCIAGGVSGVFVNGTSGEAMRLPLNVWKKNTEEVLKIVDGRVHVFCGAIDSSTAGTIERLKMIEDAGGRNAVCTAPFYLSNFGQDEIIKHFERLASSTKLNIAVYNIPETTNVMIEPQTMKRLSEIETVVAIKDSTANWQHLQRVLMLLDDTDIAIFNGAEELCAVAMLYGASGCIPGLGNYIPQVFVELQKVCGQGNVKESYRIQKMINKYRTSIFVNNCWISGMKGLLREYGIGGDTVSFPVKSVSETDLAQMRTIVSSCNL